jgi:lysophospholipase L1-like esterase
MPAMPRTFAPAPASILLFEGDSLTGFRTKPCLDTWAWQRMTGAHYGYPERVGDWIFCNRPDLRLSVRNGAIGGSTMADVLGRFETITGVLKPGLVVMTIGSNDSTRAIPLDRFRDEVRTYCSRLRELCGGRVIYLGNLVACPGASPQSMMKRGIAAPYYQAAAEVVSAEGGLAVDLGSVLLARANTLREMYEGHTIYHDGTHFNAVGAEMVAGVVLRALGLMQTPGDPAWPA